MTGGEEYTAGWMPGNSEEFKAGWLCGNLAAQRAIEKAAADSMCRTQGAFRHGQEAAFLLVADRVARLAVSGE